MSEGEGTLLGGSSVLKSPRNATLYSSAATFTIHLLPLFVLAHSGSLNTEHRSNLTCLDLAARVWRRGRSKSRLVIFTKDFQG